MLQCSGRIVVVEPVAVAVVEVVDVIEPSALQQWRTNSSSKTSSRCSSRTTNRQNDAAEMRSTARTSAKMT